MKNLTITMASVLLMVVVLVSPVRGVTATWDEALTVAENWIVRVMDNKGHWGGSDWAQVEDIQEFKRADRVIGYFCHVKPVGFIVISLRKELAPIKAYSTECNLDPESDEGLAELIKMKMEGILEAIEKPVRLSNITTSSNVQDILEIDYRQAWDELCGESRAFIMSIKSDRVIMDYQEGKVLLSSKWHQKPPYNDHCPDMGCSWPSSYYNENAPAGCGAIVMGQIMRYWAWPPNGVGHDEYVDYRDDYDWTNMLDQYNWDGQDFTNGDGNTCNQNQINAVAELCHETGRALMSDYDCDGTSSIFGDQDNAFIDYFRYSDEIVPKIREDYNPTNWFSLIKADLSENRPISYLIPDHGVVVDGWQEDTTGKRYHINYGWGDDNTTAWYNLDEILDSNVNDEGMFINIKPIQTLGNELSGHYHKLLFPYRYFDQDANGFDVTFAGGQNLQFLPSVAVTCKSGYIRFEGISFDNMRLFSIKGTETGGALAGIKIHDGGIRLHPNGSIRFH